MTTRQTRRPGARKRKPRPGFEPPRRGRGFPWWIVVVGVGMILVTAILAIALWPRSSDVLPVPTISLTRTVTDTPVRPSDTPTPKPTVTPTLESHPCIVKRDTQIYHEPSTSDSSSQNLAAGRTIHVIDTFVGDARTWYRMVLPGQNVIMYVPVEDVECE